MKFVRETWIPPNLIHPNQEKWIHLVTEEDEKRIDYYIDGQKKDTVYKDARGVIMERGKNEQAGS
jgi:hypothetical protein